MKKPVVLHPFCLAAFPVLFLLANNMGQIPVQQAWRPLLITMMLAAILTLVFGLAARNYHQGAISASLVLLLFFSYGHVFQLLEDFIPSFARHTILGTAWLAFLSLGMFVKWKIRDLGAVTKILNVFSIVLLIIPFW